MRSVPFIKVHGLGNDYVLYDLIAWGDRVPKEAMEAEGVRRMCERRLGVGGDGVLILERSASERGDARLWIINRDGSPGGVCGTGIRCAAVHLVRHHGATAGTPIRLVVGDEGKERIVEAVVTNRDGAWGARVDMGLVDFSPESVQADLEHLEPVGDMYRLETFVEGGAPPSLTGMLVSVGNPHLVCVMDQSNMYLQHRHIDSICVGAHHSPAFPAGINVHVIERPKPMDDGTPLIWIYTSERGSGPVYACTTGACAVVAACTRLGLISGHGVVDSTGGQITVDYDPETGRVFAEGEAVEVCRGEWFL